MLRCQRFLTILRSRSHQWTVLDDSTAAAPVLLHGFFSNGLWPCSPGQSLQGSPPGSGGTSACTGGFTYDDVTGLDVALSLCDLQRWMAETPTIICPSHLVRPQVVRMPTPPLHVAWASTVDHTCVPRRDDARQVESRDNRGYTPVLAAAYYGHTEVVQLLIDRFQAKVREFSLPYCSAFAQMTWIVAGRNPRIT